MYKKMILIKIQNNKNKIRNLWNKFKIIWQLKLKMRKIKMNQKYKLKTKHLIMMMN